MTSPLVLPHQVHPTSVLFDLGPCLTQSQMADLSICLCHFEPPFAKALFHSGCLDLLLKEVNLGAQCLALFIHGLVLVNFGHKTPIVAGELVERMVDHGESGPASHQGGQKTTLVGLLRGRCHHCHNILWGRRGRR